MYGSSAEFPVAGPLFGKENCRGLADKSFEKRKAAAHALQHVIKQQVSTAVATANNEEACAPADALTGDSEQNETATPSHRQRQQQRLQEKHREATQSIVQQATSALTADFLSSPIANIRKGGLLGVAAVGLAFEVTGSRPHKRKRALEPMLESKRYCSTRCGRSFANTSDCSPDMPSYFHTALPRKRLFAQKYMLA